ncbi:MULTISPECIES: NUDIX hydrolase [Streptomyces]|uniref:NUDIX hydrolase n=1 Tax=Streptomyces TaxID=1883 RepID=UPI00345C0692
MNAYVPPTWHVSIKGVAFDAAGRLLLLHNERNEWELPGGRLEPADLSPEHTVEREFKEETGWKVTAGPLLDTWLYTPIPGRRVLILTFACTALTPDQPPVLSHEHKKIGLFPVDQVPGLSMPDGYKKSIAACWARHAHPTNTINR